MINLQFYNDNAFCHGVNFLTSYSHQNDINFEISSKKCVLKWISFQQKN